MKTLSLFLEAIEPKEEGDPSSRPNEPAVQKKLDLSGAGMETKAQRLYKENTERLKTAQPRIRKEIEAGRAQGAQKVDPLGFFMQVNPDKRKSMPIVHAHMQGEMSGLHNPQTEEEVQSSLDAQRGNHPTLDYLSHQASRSAHREETAKKYTEGLQQGKITNGRLALASLFHDSQGNPGHAKSPEKKLEIMKRLIHPHADEMYEYDQLHHGDKEWPEREAQLKELLSQVGFKFDDTGKITEGYPEDMSVDDLVEKLESYVWEPDDIHSAMFALRVPHLFGNIHEESSIKLVDAVNDLLESGQRGDVSKGVAMHQQIGSNAREVLEMFKKAGVIDALPEDHFLRQVDDDIIASTGGELSLAMDEADMPLFRQLELMEDLRRFEARSMDETNPNAVVGAANNILSTDYTSNPDDDSREYRGLNVKYGLDEPAPFEGDQPYVPGENISDTHVETSWFPIIDDRGSRLGYGMDSPEDFLNPNTVLNPADIKRKMNLLGMFLKTKKDVNIMDVFEDEDLKKEFMTFAKSITAADAKNTWINHVLPDYDEGQVFRNMPMGNLADSAARRRGDNRNTRARLYKRMGFGEELDDGYQYGYKPNKGEALPSGRLKPLGYEQNFTGEIDPIEREQSYIEDVDEHLHDMDLYGMFDMDYIRNFMQSYYDNGDIDFDYNPRYAANDIHSAALDHFLENDYDPLEDLEYVYGNLVMSGALDIDEEEGEEFEEWAKENYDYHYTPLEILQAHSADELDEVIDDLLEKFRATKEPPVQPRK